MAGVDDVEDTDDKNILYDLTVQTEWRLENEIFTRAPKEKDHGSVIRRVASSLHRSTSSVLHLLGLPVVPLAAASLPEALVRMVSSQVNWNLALGSDGIVAVLQDHCLEIRSMRDNYEKPVGRAALTLDPFPQWRCMSWSPDGTMVAVSRSNGAVDIFDIMGMPIANIPCAVSSDATVPLDLSVAIACLIFTNFKPPGLAKTGATELIAISYKGLLKRYLIERESLPKLQESFSFAAHYPLGISSAVYHPRQRLLYVGGQSQSSAEGVTAKDEGITAWRILSDFPHYKLVSSQGEEALEVRGRSFLNLRRLPQMMKWKPEKIDGVFRLCLSPAEDILVVLHTSGKLSLWDVPSLRLRKMVALEEQEDFDELPADLIENPQKAKRIKDLIPHKKLVDANFWSDTELILARCTGAVVVASVRRLQNMLGKSPEWFAPSPRITATQNGGFLVLECENEFPHKRLLDMAEDHDSDDEDAAYLAQVSRLTKDWLYFFTDSKRFKPPKRKPRLVNKIYKLLLLKSTTPEELYARKIDAEEYGEALELAKSYGLDCDLVYQRRWRRSPVSIASIQDYLSKISKRSWVLHECLERVPESIDAMFELLDYGIRGTDLQALLAIGQGEDGGRFILCDPEEGLYEDMDSFDEYDAEAILERQRRKREHEANLLSQVDFQNLSLEQKELCRARLKLLQYRNRLKTYECILGGPQAAPRRFDSKFYKEFRSQNIVEAAVDYAQIGDYYALETLFTFHGKETLPHRLAILSYLPETLPPEDYKSILPEMRMEEEVAQWEEDSWWEADWSESAACRDVVDPEAGDPGDYLYKNSQELEQFRSPKELTKVQVTKWYLFRADQIEKQSRIVDHALEIIKIGIEKEVEGLEEMLDTLLLMEVLVYECNVGNQLSLKELFHMPNYEKLELMMSKSSLEMYVKNLRRWMVPFLVRCERKKPGAYDQLLGDYIITHARRDLTYVVKIFETSKLKVVDPVIRTQELLMSIALDALYACQRSDQLNLYFEIFKCLPHKGYCKETAETIKLHKQVDKLEYHLSALQTLQSYGIATDLAYIRETENDSAEAEKLMIKLTRMVTKRIPPASVMDWHRLRSDVTDLQDKVFRCLAPQLCLEIFVETLMGAGYLETIKLVGEFIERSQEASQKTRQKGKASQVEYHRALELCSKVAQEFFNSAASLSDSNMELARACLHLILDTPEVVQRELDLIGALAVLADFSVNVLPVQVRFCENRLDLVQKAIESRPKSYRQAEKLVRLAHLLRVSAASRQERESVVLLACAKSAIQVRDVDYAYKYCRSLIGQGCQVAWSACVALAELEEMTDVQAKLDLLSFAITYCTPEKTEAILQAKCLLETKILCDQVSRGMKDGSPASLQAVSDSSQEASFSTKKALQQTAQILSSTTSKTRAMLSTVTDKHWWQGAIHSLKQPAHRQSSVTETDDGNAAFHKQGCHPFYEDSIESAYVNSSAVNYHCGKSRGLPEADLSANILRTARLEESLTSGNGAQPVNEGSHFPRNSRQCPSPLKSVSHCPRQPPPLQPGPPPLPSPRAPRHPSPHHPRNPSPGPPRPAPTPRGPLRPHEPPFPPPPWEPPNPLFPPSAPPPPNPNNPYFPGRKPPRGRRSAVLLELAKSYLSRDSSLGLAYLLALPQGVEAESCFDVFPCTAISMQLAAYYYALQVYSSLQPAAVPRKNDLYLHDPSRVIRHVVQHITSHPEAEWPQEVVELVPKLLHYQELLDDYNQARTLNALHTGIDVTRFAEDGEYRKETILGLAMNVESQTFQMAISLAQRYNLPLWEVYMAHVEFLFSDSGLSTEEMSSRLERSGLLSTLTDRPAAFCQRMYTYVYPTIAGTDHDRLLYFFSLLGTHAEGSLRGIDPNAHVKLLRKIKGMARDLDYKKLMDDSHSPLSVLEPVLTNGNINSLAKLASKIPAGGGQFLQPSVVYSAWAARKFWDAESAKSNTSAAWVHRFEACGEFFVRLLPEDFLSFVENLVFTERARQKLPLSARQEIVKRSLKQARLAHNESRKKKKDAGEGTSVSWEVVQQLQQQSTHLDRLTDSFLVRLAQSEDKLPQLYASLYDLSAGCPDKLRALLLRMVWDGQSVDSVQNMLMVAPIKDWTIQTVFSEAIGQLVQAFREPGARSELPEKYKPLDTLQVIASRVQEHSSDGGELVTAEDVTALLRPFCSDSTVPVEPRLDVLNILGKNFNLSVDDSLLLMFYRTRVLVSRSWPYIELSEKNICSEAAREKLFQRLLSDCTDIEQLTNICRLLHLWPQPGEKRPEISQWMAIFSKIVSFPGIYGVELANAMLEHICGHKTPLSLEESRQLFEVMVAGKEELECVKFAMLSGYKELYPAAMAILATHTQIMADRGLIRLLLQRGLLPQMVGTVYYSWVIEMMMEKMGDPASPPHLCPDTLIAQLRAAGLQAEAGSLMLKVRSPHRLLHTFACALHFARNCPETTADAEERDGEERESGAKTQAAAKPTSRTKVKSKAD